jgi:LPS-assembly protein
VETSDFILRAEEIDYNQDTQYAEARGSVRFLSFERGEELEADRVEYFLKEHRGLFYRVRGSVPPKVDLRPGLLMTTSPFVFEGKWAERKGDRYVLHEGTITNCRTPRPLWTLRGRRFDIVPGHRAIVQNSSFHVKHIPLFFTPFFYKSLETQPRKSGFLMPNIGNSSRRGKMIATGYFWAINRSYDLTYRSQLFTQRGFAHHVDFRGKPREGTEFSTYVYGVNDRGLKLDNGERLKQGGFLVELNGKSDLPRGWIARGEGRYLNSFTFRQAFTESFNEAVFSEVHSRGFAAKHWSTFALNVVAERNENYPPGTDEDRISIRKLPEIAFSSRDRLISSKVLPVWVSLDSAAGLVRRNQPLFQTRQFVDRFDVTPRVMTALRWKGISLLPAFAVRETHWGSSQLDRKVIGEGLRRSAREFSLDLVPPSVGRVFDRAPKWLGDKFKHVIEPRAGFRTVAGIQDFSRIIRFDETELLTNTRELDYSITNRVFVKRGAAVNEVLSWQVWQKRYLDPDLGGAVITGQRNVFLTQTEMTGYAFFDRPRKFSPVVSSLRAQPTPAVGFEWRADYDTVRHRVVNSTLVASWRWDKYSVMAGHNHLRSNPVLSPSSNQFIGVAGWGAPDQRGWSVGFQSVYDFRLSIMQFATTQISYNTECCGFSVQYRRFSFGPRNENQYRVAFAVANIGSFGSLRRQERIF